MIGAIGSAAAYTEQAPSSTAGLEAQLSRCRQQLSETVNCASYHTLEGKTKAQSLSNRIGELEGRIEQIRSNATQNKEVKASEKPDANAHATASATQDATTDPYSSGPLGTRLNVYA